MRERLYEIVLEDFLAGLAELGYYKVHPRKEPCLNWRRGEFHVLLQHKGHKRLIVSLHIDKPFLLPPYHQAVLKGKRLKEEFGRIMESYREMRRKRGVEKDEVSSTS